MNIFQLGTDRLQSSLISLQVTDQHLLSATAMLPSVILMLCTQRAAYIIGLFLTNMWDSHNCYFRFSLKAFLLFHQPNHVLVKTKM